jgi:peptidyl-prolyl cis-trans isomerase D
MLQAIRSKTAGIVVKILFIVLVASFAVWGIGDYAFLRRGEQVAIRVGDAKITPEQLSIEYRREVDRLRRSFGQFDLEMAKQIGLIDQVIDRMVRDTLFEKEAARLGVVVSDEVVRARIAANPAFHGLTGTFDRNMFQRILYENGYNEGQYIQLLRQELARAAVIDSITAGTRAPDLLVDRLYRHRNERRTGETIFIPNSSIEVTGEPDDAQLKSVYDDNAAQFSEPEYRALSVLRVGADELAPKTEVSEEQLKEEFHNRMAEFRVEEKRDLEQMLFTDEDAAKAAATKVASAPFVDVAREDAKQTPEQTRIDGARKADLVPELADPVFALAEGGVAGPIKSPFGWHVMRIAKIYPGKEPNLDDVRDKLKETVARRLATAAAYDAAVRVEDAMGAGASLADAAAKAGLALVKVPAIDARGANPKGEVELILADTPEVLQAAFQTAQGQETQLTEARNGAYFIVHVDNVTPPRVKPIDEVKPQLLELWKTEQQSAGARKRAEQIVERIAQGKALAETAAEFNLKVDTTPPARRDGSADAARIPGEVATQLFAAKRGDLAVVPAGDGHHVVRLAEILPADPAADQEGFERLRAALGRQIGNDLVVELAAALRERYSVSVDTQAIERLL